MKKKYLGSRGDTIVEVLIAIAVVSGVLGGAYVSASRSLNGSRQSQERGEALKLAEGQLERIKAATTSATTMTAPFCMDSNNNPVAASNSACKPNLGGPIYTETINRSGNTFTVQISWDRAGGGGNENATLVYRVYP